MNFRLHSPQQAFTLAETLIVLIIVAEIAIFTVPKLISNQQNNLRRSLFKETVSNLNTLLYNGTITGQITDDVTLRTYIFNNTNAVKICPNNSQTEGCWVHPDGTGASARTEPGFVLPSGVVVSGFGSGGLGDEAISIDSNGAQPPDIEGEDQIRLKVYYITAGANRKGTIIPDPGRVLSEALWTTFW